jgi:hypothetical protein
MTRYISLSSVIGALALLALAGGSGIPDRIDGWRVEVGPPGFNGVTSQNGRSSLYLYEGRGNQWIR